MMYNEPLPDCVGHGHAERDCREIAQILAVQLSADISLGLPLTRIVLFPFFSFTVACR